MTNSEIEQLFAQAAAHYQAGRLTEAERILRQILSQQPNHADALHLLGVMSAQAGRHDAAIDLIERAIAAAPSSAAYRVNLGLALNALGRSDDAIASYRQAIELKSEFGEAHFNLGRALRNKGNLEEAIAALRQAIAINPNYAEAHFILSTALLAMGDFQRGWEEYEWRWQCRNFPSRRISRPQWDGSALEGRTLFLYAEQGIGDAIQFIRYLPLVLQKQEKIVVLCQVELQRLFKANSGSCQIIAEDESVPTFDVHCPLLSLPRALGTNLANIPQNVPYLHAEPGEIAKWRDRLSSLGTPANVGLVWAGNRRNANDRNRSLPLAKMAPLSQVGVQLISLQKGEAAAEAKSPHAGMELVDWTDELKDFADTAALIANLDLVIAVDTAVAHLAGAMGKAVWTLLPYVSDWRWMTEREDSSWYPSMRLFRQPRWGDWNGVVADVVEALFLWVQSRG